MAGVSLVKGEKVDLSKDANLSVICVAAGWDINPAATGGTYDLDIFAIAAGADKKPITPQAITYFGQKQGVKGVVLDGDNLTGEGDGDDETITITLPSIEENVHELVFAINIFNGAAKGQRFGMVQNAYIRIYNHTNGEELVKFDLNEDFGSKTGVVAGKMYRHNGEWKFEAIGTGVDGDINVIAASL